jgi:1,4-dihydroxy-2-naphthoate polyprenyltransferase
VTGARKGIGRPRLATVAGAVALMTRPSQLLLLEVVALLGVSLARARGADTDPATLAAGLLLVLPVSASVHLANEYADHETDARTSRTPFSGGSGALSRTGLGREIALSAALGAAAIGLAGTLAAAALGTIPVPAAAILLVGTVVGWSYSVGPFPLAWHGLGEGTNALLGGMLMPLFGVALVGGALDGLALAAFAPLTLVVAANLLATTWPDRAADASVGKRTLATRWPASRLRLLYAALALGALAILVVQATGPLPVVVVAAGLSAAPLLAVGFATYTRIESAAATVGAMVWLVVAQLVAWWAVGS